MKFSFILLISIALNLPKANAQDACMVELPVSFHENLIYLNLAVNEKDTLLFYLDTGGKNFYYGSARKKVKFSKLEQVFMNADLNLGLDLNFYKMRSGDTQEDAMLGREWFSQGNWEIDFCGKSMNFISGDCLQYGEVTECPLFFKKNEAGDFSSGLARIIVEIDGQLLSLLLDTGAQANLSVEAQQSLNAAPLLATSFINASIFDNWRMQHPDWLIIEAADHSFGMNESLIVVPEIKIGGEPLGPVAFVRREDSNFKIMSELFMDESIVGALGANALSHFGRCNIDYPNEVLRTFEPVDR